MTEPEVELLPLYATKKPRSFWSRSRLLLLIAAVWGICLWYAASSAPTFGGPSPLAQTLHGQWWLLVLFALEALRQFNYLLSEHSGRWNHIWSDRIWGGTSRAFHLSDWAKYRAKRLILIVLVIASAGIIAGHVEGVNPVQGLFSLPSQVASIIGELLYFAAIMCIAVGQFVLIFWYMARGGIDVYFPDDIKTRFNHVWGQDQVLQRIQESMLFLQHPERIEDHGGYVPGGILLYGPPGPQPLSAKVLTPTGWTTMGELKVGDLVVGTDGEGHPVEEVYDFGERDIFKVQFSDGAVTRADLNHKWAVQTKKLRRSAYVGLKGSKGLEYRISQGRRWLMVTTGDLVARSGRGVSAHSIPVPSPVDFQKDVELPLHPYVLGALLGDGTLGHIPTEGLVPFTNSDAQIAELMSVYVEVRQHAGIRWGVNAAKELNALGLGGASARHKFIPEAYLWASREQREQLLHGLMDTDGSVHTRPGRRPLLYWRTTSSQMRDQFLSLVRSLGGVAEVVSTDERQEHPCWTVRLTLPANIAPFTTDERLTQAVGASTEPIRYVDAVIPDGRERVRCILVDVPDHLYVTDDYIVCSNTGKTLIAEALAGETKIPFVSVDAGSFNAMFMGVGILKVKGLYRKLRKLATRHGGVIVFFDEADSLGSRGSLAGGGIFKPGGVNGAISDCHGGAYLSEATVSYLIQDRAAVMGGMGMNGGGMGTLQALLSEMSGLSKPRGFMNRVVRRALGMPPKAPPKFRILTIMATNMPNSLDEALLRPGRIDRIYKVGYPSKTGRVKTYEGYFGRVQHNLTPADIEKLATLTPYATGATMKDLVNESLILSLRRGHDKIEWADVLEAKRLKDLGLPEDVEYIERERHAIAIHEACHAVTAYYVRKHLEIDLATIEKGGTYLGMVSSIKPEDRFTSWKSEYEADVMVALASLAGERLFFDGDSSSGVSGDLETATKVVALMEGLWGMGKTIAAYEPQKEVKELTQGPVGRRVEKRLGELLERVRVLLVEHRKDVCAVAHALESHKTLSGEDVAAVIRGETGRAVDGSVYADPNFFEVYTEYHDRLRQAHAERKSLTIPLPQTSEWLS